MLQHKSIRIYLGVHTFSANAAIDSIWKYGMGCCGNKKESEPPQILE
jgi:hypothetical protein